VGEISGELQAMERKLFQKERTSSPESSTIIDREEIDTAKWISNVNQAIDEIKNERAKKIVIAREMHVKLDKQAEIGVMLKKLVKMQPTSYVFAFEQGKDCFIGATPERL